MQTYVYPKLSDYDFLFFRTPGPGLGNLLFPWARAVLLSKLHDIPLVNPTWPQIKFGPLSRWERDCRAYFDLFSPATLSIRGTQKACILHRSRKVNEQQFCEMIRNGSSVEVNKRNVLIICEGLGQFFLPLREHREIIYPALLDIVRDRHLEALKVDFRNSISCHVRLGDFDGTWRSTSIEWYRDTLLQLRSDLGSEIHCNIFSDGTDKQLKTLLDLPNTQRLSFDSAIADLIALANSRVLICGPNSSFSQWALFLGQMPFVMPEINPIFELLEDSHGTTGYIGQLSDFSQHFLAECETSLIKAVT